MNRAGCLIPTSSIFFQPSGEIYGGTAVWALHTTRLLSIGLNRGGLALPADGIRFCFAWQGASTHDPQWVEPNHTASTVPTVFQTLLHSPGNTVAVTAEIWASVLCWCCMTRNNSSWSFRHQTFVSVTSLLCVLFFPLLKHKNSLDFFHSGCRLKSFWFSSIQSAQLRAVKPWA